MRASTLFLAFATALCSLACGGTSTIPSDPNDGGGSTDSAATHDAPTTTLAACSATCGAGSYCAYPRGPGICPMGADAGFCPEGCPGCPALPPPSCAPMPAACTANPSCDCLLTNLCTGCGSPSFSQCGVKNGEWIVGCLSC